MKDIAIVFGAYINPAADWRMLISAQLNDLREAGLLSVCDLFLIVSDPSHVEGVVEFFAELPIIPAHLEFVAENKYEYPALSCVWGLATGGKQYKYIGYLHTKGISYAKSKRSALEQELTRLTFCQWRRVIAIFEEHPEVEKIGLFPDDQRGFVWFNFWWARARLINTLPRPEESDDRYYYESWLGAADRTGGCYSIFDKSDSTFSLAQAAASAQYLVWKAKYGVFAKARMFCERVRGPHRGHSWY